MKVAFAASDETVRRITAEGFRALARDRADNPSVVLTEIDPRDPGALDGRAAVLLDIPDEQIARFGSPETSADGFEVPVSFVERYPIIASRPASPALGEQESGRPDVDDERAPGSRFGARGFRSRRKAKLVASFAAAGMVTVAMVSADALTRDALPTPAATELVEIKVRSSVLLLARTRSARRRQRARLTMHLSVTNISGRRLVLGQPVLLAGRARVPADLSGRARLPNQLSRDTTTEVELRFLLASEVARRLVGGGRLHLRLARQTIPVTRRSLDSVGPRR